MSMLKCFFEIGTDTALSDGLADNEQLCKEYMGKYPVIFISPKNVEGLDYEAAKYQMIELIAKEARSCPLRIQGLMSSLALLMKK